MRLGLVTRRRRRRRPLLGGAVVLAVTAAAFVAGPVPARTTDRGGRVEVLRLRVPGQGEQTRPVWVYRPRVRDSARLPVLYFLHGLPGSPRDVFDTGLRHSLDAYFAAGHRPFVVVAPDGNGTQHGDTEWANAADGSDQVESFLTGVVIPAIEGRNRRDAAHRAIAGFSMGGYGAMNIALRHRELFGQVVSVAGYFHVDDPDGMFADEPGLIAANSPDRMATAARGLRILLLDGDADAQPVVRGEAERFAAVLQKARVPVEVSITPGGHSWSYVSSELDRIERFLEARWNR